MKKLILILALSSFILSCSKKESTELKQINSDPIYHKWYFFTKNNFEETSLPQKSDINSLKPWTEAFRCSDAQSSKNNTAYLLVNRLGVVVLEEEKEPILIQDYQLFSDATASNLVFYRKEPYFTLSRSSFFNKNATLKIDSKEDSNRPFLVRVCNNSKMLYPVVTYGDLKLATGGEITGSYFDGLNWFCSIKTEQMGRNFFSYIKWTSLQDLSTFPSYTKENKLSISNSSESEYRNLNSPLPLSKAPNRLKNLLSSIPKDFGFSINLYETDGFSPTIYEDKNDNHLTKANALIDDSWICAIFSDGTTYFNGALADREILNNGKNIAFRLPKLPSNYLYGKFCIYGKMLAVTWEETDFYKTGRSGFLTVDLEKVLYGEADNVY